MSKQSTVIFLLGGAVGGILLMAVSFSMGWIVSSGRAEATAKEMSADAVKAQLVPICLYQFHNQADSAGRLDALRDLEQWSREGYVAEHGWATMPGGDSPVAGVARECSAQLVKDVS